MVSKFGFNTDGDLFSLAALPSQYAGLQMKSANEHANVLPRELNELGYGLLQAYEPVLRDISDPVLEHETVLGDTVYRLIAEHKSTVTVATLNLSQRGGRPTCANWMELRSGRVKLRLSHGANCRCRTRLGDSPFHVETARSG
ncbi:hypothetical protein QFZ94_002175 [Paraburkholderia sp. JPY465]